MPGAALSDDSLQYVVWILRLILPILLFWISFGPKITLPWTNTWRRYSRDLLLQQRERFVAEGTGVPDVLATLIFVTEEQAPALFQEQKKEKEKKSDRESRDRDKVRSGGAGRDRERERASKDQRKGGRKLPPPPTADPPPVPAEEADSGHLQRDERIHLESLVNFVAFNRRAQQRTFLHDPAGAPPPPPPPPQPRQIPEGGDPDVATEEDLRANAEAKMVIRGALRVAPKAALVSQALYGQLSDLSIRIDQGTFELMVEASIEANDLQTASDFLMRMESSGYIPGNELLDRLMELYLKHKRAEEEKAEEEKAAAPQPSLPMGPRRPPPPPPPPPPDRQWGHGAEGMDVGSFSPTVNDGVGLCSVPETSMYSVWGDADALAADPAQAAFHWSTIHTDGVAGAQAVLGRYGLTEGGLRQRRGAGGSGHKSSSSSSSGPAFAVPDEFRAKDKEEEPALQSSPEPSLAPLAEEPAMEDGGSDNDSGADAGAAAAGLGGLAAASALSADAAVFVPAGNSATEVFAPGGLGVLSAEDVLGALSPEEAHLTGEERGPLEFGFNASRWQSHGQAFGDPSGGASGAVESGDLAQAQAAVGMISTGQGEFEFSAGAPVFQPGSSSAAASDAVHPPWSVDRGEAEVQWL